MHFFNLMHKVIYLALIDGVTLSYCLASDTTLIFYQHVLLKPKLLLIDLKLTKGPYTEKLMGGSQKCSYDGPGEVNCAYHEHNAGIIYLAHQAGAEVYPSIGGWTLR
jgi:hypothetical protein